MITNNIAEMTARIDAHRAADLLVRGTYYDASTGKGCFIGCLAHGNRPETLAETYGIPVPLTRVLERIFESLPSDEAADFFTAIPRSIGTDGKDLSRVVWAFLGETLRSLPPQKPEIQAVINPVIAGMDLLASGKQWPQAEAASARAEAAEVLAAAAEEEEAWVAAWAARAAAEAACVAAEADDMDADEAAWAARAAAEAAWAAAEADDMDADEALDRQRDSILRLMSEAPVIHKST